MPFTFAHPAAILPLKDKRLFNRLALVLGTMAPDFEYFLHLKPYEVYGHSFLGQFFYNLPLVLVIAIIYTYVIKDPMYEYLPTFIKRRFQITSNRFLDIVSIKFVVSALIGMFTHLIWDSFTHYNGFVVSKVSFLRGAVLLDYPLYKVIQHGSTLLGFMILAIYIYKLSKKNAEETKRFMDKVIFFVGMGLLTAVITLGILVLSKDLRLGSIVVTTISSSMIALLFFSILERVRALI